MPSDKHVGSLLRTLIATKPSGNFLELGTGIGLSLAWMLAGMDEQSRLISLDNDEELINIVTKELGADSRLELLCTDGTAWLKNYNAELFDLIFADTWPGKYNDLDEALNLVKPGGLYVVDDMTEQPNWPDGHAEKAKNLVAYLHSREDFHVTVMDWSTGVIVASKVPA